MFNSLVEAELYIPPIRLCKNCGRLGHIAVRCRSHKRCLLCGNKIICPNQCGESKCDFCLSTIKCNTFCSFPRCILCNDNKHNAMDAKKCPKYSEEKNLYEAMAISNLSRKEVVQKNSPNYYAILDDPQYENEFPTISKVSKPTHRTLDEEFNRKITRTKYSKIATEVPKRSHDTADVEHLIPTKPTFDFKNFSKVSNYEKILSSFTHQMTIILSKVNCSEGLDMLNSFANAIKATTEENSVVSPNNENFTAQYSEPN